MNKDHENSCVWGYRSPLSVTALSCDAMLVRSGKDAVCLVSILEPPVKEQLASSSPSCHSSIIDAALGLCCPATQF